AWIHVGRAHIRPASIDGDELGVIEVSRRTPYAAAISHYLVELREHGVVDQSQVIAAWNHDIHHDAPARRRIDGAKQYLVGQEVGRLYAYVMRGHGKCAQKHVVGADDIAIRTGTDAACRYARYA